MAERFAFTFDPNDLRTRAMTPAERRGFRHACQTLQLWGAQIERNATGLEGQGEKVSLDEQMKSSARMLQGCASAMERTLGR
ncbi:MAG: hypothetical protein AAF891_00235 [Pseudomonadota bacterium]